MPNYHRDNYTDAEINQLAVKNGWKASDSINFNDVQRMTSPQVRFYEIHAADALEAAIASKDKPTQKWISDKGSSKVSLHNKISLAEQQAARRNSNSAPVRVQDFMPEDLSARPTEEELEFFRKEWVRFCNDYLQVSVATCPENFWPEGPVHYWLSNHRAQLTYGNLVTCLNDIPGEFIFDLAAIGLGNGKEKGDVLQNTLSSKDYSQLTKPHPVIANPQETEDRMSSNEFKKHSQQQHPEDWVRPASAFAVNDATLAVNSFVSLHPAYQVSYENREKIETYLSDNKLPTTYNHVEAAYLALVAKGEIQPKADTVVQGKVLKAIDLGGSKPGYPDLDGLSKESLKAAIRNMTSVEYDKKLKDDPSFRRAVDSLE